MKEGPVIFLALVGLVAYAFRRRNAPPRLTIIPRNEPLMTDWPVNTWRQ